MIGRIYYKIKNFISWQPKRDEILEMIFVSGYELKEYELGENYILRQFDFSSAADNHQFNELMKKNQMGACPLDYWRNPILPGGFFVIEFIPKKMVIASCFASHQPSANHPFAGNLGWLAVDSEHRGQMIGNFLVNEVVKRLLSSGYDRIYLGTHDFRLPAIKLYLKQGWMPFIYNESMLERWENIYENLNIPQEKEHWIYKNN